ncbi:MAG: T9SS type A sorting domain-containing protein [Schleiferiaceae bacterium]|jgi:hypothetical protein|nr:T9SS type A sorting domain-containing protein [Schleiferiaceae bacterium]MDP4627031.1 T9SS type A sorting domain-containing protein [Schleiferiaceae bacterium]MDP4728281.1 T9SS type A sorting domain-containing protein [Schleiferiaceae bacterium]MDP4749467.1 T9SS type A sorting domain-containing protein [Schleiferiaceae bacterium]MDP4858936.1 T9SS type A sorting domain-containing protein [Schleiferiaceae bacterium]
MKKTLTLAAALVASAAFAQVSVTFKVDITDYLASGATLGAGGMRVGGNFGDWGGTFGGNAMSSWSPSDANSAMTDEGSNVWSITVQFPSASVGSTLLYKFVDTDWTPSGGTPRNEGFAGSTIATDNCGVDDGSGNINRTLVVPTANAALLFCYDACFQCDGSSPNLSTRELSLNDLTVSPNPAADFTKVAFSTRKAGDVSVRVLNLLGQEVKTLAAGSLEAGNHSFVWNLDANNGGAVEMGTYMVEIVANGVKSVEKVFVTK